MIKPKALLADVRRKRPLIDHLVRMVQRYQEDTGDRLAASVTFYWFLSLFPILLLVVAGYGYLHGNETPEQLNQRLARSLGDFLPPQLIDTLTETLATAKGKAGLLGLGGLLISGLGWIDALREAIRTIWHQNTKAGNIITRKLIDIVVLVGLFATIAASSFVTALAGSGPAYVLDKLGVAETPVAEAFLGVLGFLLGLVVDLVLFVYLFVRLAKVPTPVRQVLKGALFGAIGFGVLKLFGGFYVQRTTTAGEATYGTFAVVVGLLLFLNLISRLVLLAAAFVVTAPGDSDVRPSGTADPEQARKAGIPEEYAADDMNLKEDGAPTPLRGALTGPPQQPARSWSPSSGAAAGPLPPATTEPAPAVSPELKGSRQVQRAAQATALVGALVVGGVWGHGLRTVRGLMHR